MNETPLSQKREKVSNMRLLLKAGLGILLFDRWIVQPVKVFAAHKGPYIKFTAPSRKRRGKRKETDMKKHWGIASIGIVAVIAIVAVTVWGVVKTKLPASLGGTPAA